jgi:FKBP-type peptidyl-prolyl cis-trans isomerase
MFFSVDLCGQIIAKDKPLGGKDPESINPQDAVLIDFVGRASKDKFDIDGPILQEAKGWMVIVGEGDVLPCIELAIRFMQTGDTSRVWSHSKYAMGPGTRSYSNSNKGNNNDETTHLLPPNSSVMYEIKVTMIVMDTSRLNPYFTIQKASTRKTIANDIYQHEWCPPPASPDNPICDMAMTRSVRLYTKVAKDMETLLAGTYFSQVEQDHPQRLQSKQLMLDCLNNIVAVHLRQQNYHVAKQAAVEVLRQDPTNLKALLRAAKAALFDPASTLEEVEASLQAAEEEITYKNPAEEKQLKQLKVQFKKKRREYNEQSKAMFGNKLKEPSS